MYLPGMIRAVSVFAVCGLVTGAALAGQGHEHEDRLADIRLPPGFKIAVFASGVPNARSMTLGERTLFVGSRLAGSVYALPLTTDANGVVTAGDPISIATGLNMPNGVAYRRGALFVAEINRILRFDDVEYRLDHPEFVVVSDDYPSVRHHGWKYIAFGPDDKLYVPIGAPCNVCTEEGYAVITRMDPDGSNREIFAHGVRNTVGFTWQPDSDIMWFTDNGRDWMGDDLPPCELNRAPAPGMHFGFPHCHGDGVVDPDFSRGHGCDEFTPPAQALGPHVAPLGLKFYTGDMFPEEYHGRIFIAEHGSWNRSEPIGYRITMVDVEGEMAGNYRVFAEGWLNDGHAWGRPVDVHLLPDGSMLVSDDKAGQIYRISYDAAIR
ncbi:MAG: sorbosone dehydrogenase [Gammaproteobacteria bacterium SG8_31]|jgi:glucose/arabinose dehydrogenase|nr:MAG: sorbosone dehydrogenase [Gammaproteobacteria bacterium SG8_31]